MEVPSESFHRSSWDSRTCYPRRAFNQRLTNDSPVDQQCSAYPMVHQQPTVQRFFNLRRRYTVVAGHSVNRILAAVHGNEIENQLPQDAINPAHGSLLMVNSPSHGIFSLFLYKKTKEKRQREDSLGRVHHWSCDLV